MWAGVCDDHAPVVEIVQGDAEAVPSLGAEIPIRIVVEQLDVRVGHQGHEPAHDGVLVGLPPRRVRQGLHPRPRRVPVEPLVLREGVALLEVREAEIDGLADGHVGQIERAGQDRAARERQRGDQGGPHGAPPSKRRS